MSIMKKLEKMCTEKCIPFYAAFELTYRCNLRCGHCYIAEDPGDELTFEEIEGIFDQLVKIGTFVLIFTGGEILVRDDFFDIARAARSRGFFLLLLTNGTLIHEGNVDEIADLKPMDVEISLYGARKETHDHVTKVNGSFDRAVKAIKLLVDKGVRAMTKTVLMDYNVTEYEEIKSLSESLGALPRINVGIVPRKDGSLLPMRHDVDFEGVRSYLSDLSEMAQEKTSPEPALDPLERLRCGAGRSVCAISPYGDVSPCLLMPVKLGNVREQTVADIWYQKGNELLNGLRSPDTYESSPCLSCELLSTCTRCPGVAYMETGNPFGRSPSACKYASWRAKSEESTSYEGGRHREE
jgi:radical SAM protein with 4Fe4S-binding SPASM domain